jgi:hypothetical protein
MQPLAAGDALPPGSLPQGFAKAVTILEEAVRGFGVGLPHGGFWTGVTRDQFLAATPAGQHPVAQLPDGTVDVDPGNSALVKRLEGTTLPQMPLLRPPVPAPRIAYIRDWIAGGAPDDVPAGQIGVHHEQTPAAEVAGPVGGAPSFATDIKGLFRDTPDRTSMLFAFDLHVYEDVRDHATDILQRLENGTMPCDGAWPSERIALFQQWVDSGSAP